MEDMQRIVPRRPLSLLCAPMRPLASVFQDTCTLNVYTTILPRRGYLRAKVESEGSLCPSAQCWTWPTGEIWIILNGRKEEGRKEERGEMRITQSALK